jgi:hypothetical protein
LASFSNEDLDAIVHHCIHPPTPGGKSEDQINDQHEKRSMYAHKRRKEVDAASDLDAFEIHKQEEAAIKESLRQKRDAYCFEREWGGCWLPVKSWRYVSLYYSS